MPQMRKPSPAQPNIRRSNRIVHSLFLLVVASYSVSSCSVEKKKREEEEEGNSGMAERDAAGGDVVVRVLCPVDRIEAVSRLSVGGARIRFDCASASPFPSDRVVLISALPSDHSGSQSQSEEESLTAALLGVFERIALPSPLPPRLDFHHAACRLLLSPSSPLLSSPPRLDDAGALIRLFPREHAFPAFSGPPHHLLTITGPFPSVKHALLALAPFLLPSHTPLLVPSHYLPFLTASDGAELAHIQQISGANLTVQEPKPSETMAKLIIFGTAEQTKTAQSLLHGLIFCGVFDPS